MVLPTSGSISISDINSCARFTNGNMGINTTSPNYNLDINGTLKATTITAGNILATTSISSGAVNATNSTVTNSVVTSSTVTNVIATNVSSGTLNLSTGLTAGTILATTSISSGSVNATNSTVTNLYSLNSTLSNLRSTLTSIGTLRTDLGVITEGLMVKASINTSLTAGDILATTSVSSGAVYATNSTVTNLYSLNSTLSNLRSTLSSIGTLRTDLGVMTEGLMTKASISTSLTVGDILINNGALVVKNSDVTGWGKFEINGTAGSYIDFGPDTIDNRSRIEHTETDRSLRFRVNGGTPVMTLASSGNVGIGTASPSSLLSLISPDQSVDFQLLDFRNTSNYGIYAQTDSINARGNNLRFLARDYNTNNLTTRDVLTMRPEGNVGIGTNSPTSRLNVSGDTDLFGALRVGSSSSSTDFLINLGTSGVGTFRSALFYGQSNNIYLSNQQNGSIGFGTNNTLNRFTIYADGRCGIGTSSTPVSNGLQINSGEFQLGSNSSSAFHMQASNGGLEFYSGTWGSGTYVGRWFNNGLTVVGSLSKGSGTFDIQHPLHQDDSTKRLVHSFIEGPRCDLIYRGKVQLVNGTATINIDSDCVEETGSEMTQGTFEALCANPQFFLQNPSSFSRLKGSISGNVLTVVCEDQNSSDIIYWSVIAERKDAFIKQWERTNANGYLITEYEGINNIPSLG